ncbi:hypothetical protein IQ63_25800 [Streptomyces acidiscabies]|uniref:Uncharacterized protein n=1 Tax=Streptomyces acidiscabies TaxID=42234 RepID=A0A0L0K1V5_9ACTN|nr:hypothetical protein IQ63_25800 [Streptomyces acidiscabies]
MGSGVVLAAGLSEFQQNLVVAVVGTVVGVLGTVAIERVKMRREPVKRLSWEAEVHNAMVSTDDSIRQRLRLSYNGVSIDGLSSIEFRVENTGNRVVKDEQLRFRLPTGAQVIEATPTSAPEREMGVVRRPEREQDAGEVVFSVAQLERGQTLALRLSVSAPDVSGWKVFAHNDEGDVEFHERSAARRKQDREHVPTFFTLAFLLVAVPPLVSLLGDTGRLAAVVVGGALLVAVTPHVAPTGRTLRDFLTQKPEPSTQVHIGSVAESTFSVGDRSSAQTTHT